MADAEPRAGAGWMPAGPRPVHADVLAAVEACGGGAPMSAAPVLAGTEDHPHARMALVAALPATTPRTPTSSTGPRGCGKRTAARALAAELLAAGSADHAAAPRAWSRAPTPT